MYKTLQLKSRWACWSWWWFFEVWNLRFCNSGFAAKFTVKRECLQKFALCCGSQQKLTKYLLRSSEVTSFKDLRKGNWSNRSLTNWIDNHLQLKLRWAYIGPDGSLKSEICTFLILDLLQNSLWKENVRRKLAPTGQLCHIFLYLILLIKQMLVLRRRSQQKLTKCLLRSSEVTSLEHFFESASVFISIHTYDI